MPRWEADGKDPPPCPEESAEHASDATTRTVVLSGRTQGPERTKETRAGDWIRTSDGHSWQSSNLQLFLLPQQNLYTTSGERRFEDSSAPPYRLGHWVAKTRWGGQAPPAGARGTFRTPITLTRYSELQLCKLTPRSGLEPLTPWLTAKCSAY